MYLFIWLHTLCTYEKYFVSEKYINKIKVKQLVRKKSGQKTNERRRNKMISRVRLIRKTDVGHSAISAHSPEMNKTSKS